MRRLDNWFDSYIEYTEETESAPIFHRWMALSMIGAALRKKTWISLGRIKVFPNLYVVLVAEPGIARKTQAINYGVEILSEIPQITLSADATTPQALLEDLELSADDAQMPDATMLRHSSLNIVSKEFESFLGQKKDNTKMLVILTDLFDCQEIPWKYRTKHSKSNIIPSVFLNLMGATTPEGLANSLPSAAIGSGLTSRIIFIWASRGGGKQPYPEMTEKMELLKRHLIHDLSVIARVSGNYNFTPECKELWAEWYLKYDERDPARVCKDPSFNGWYSRKPMFILKMAHLFTVCKHSEPAIDWSEIQRSIRELASAEELMGQTFAAVGRSEVTADVNLLMSIIKQRRAISEQDLLRMVWRDMDSKKFDIVVTTAIRTGRVMRKFKSPTGETAIWYFWVK